jgi:hypothetical protein
MQTIDWFHKIKNHIDQEKTSMNREELIRKKKELEDRLEKIRQDLGRGLDADFSEQAIQLENHDVLLEIARVSDEELLKINRQLNSAD